MKAKDTETAVITSACERLSGSLGELRRSIQAGNAGDSEALRSIAGKVRAALKEFESSRGLMPRDRDRDDPDYFDDGFEIASGIKGLLEFVTGSRVVEGSFPERNLPTLALAELRYEALAAIDGLLVGIPRYVETCRATNRSRIERLAAEDKAIELAKKLDFLGPAIVILEQLYEKTETFSEPAYRHAANAMVPAIAELLALPAVESRLKNVTANDLVEIIRRQDEERNQAKAAA